MEIKDYPSNSFKNKEVTTNNEPVVERKRAQKVVTGEVKLAKKSGFRKFINNLIADDMPKVKDYIVTDVLIPSVKQAISNIVGNGINMILYGDSNANRKSTNLPVSNVSYASYYKNNNQRLVEQQRPNTDRSGLDYDNIVLPSRGEAELVLSQLEEIIMQYQFARIADLYDLVGISTNNHCANNYGWTNLSDAKYIMVRDGYLLKLPRAVPIDN